MKLEEKLKQHQIELNKLAQQLAQLNESRKILASEMFRTEGKVFILKELIEEEKES